MSGPGPKDQDRTSIETQAPPAKGLLTLDPDLLEPPEEATMQGASYMVERITPAPARSAMDPRAKPPSSQPPPGGPDREARSAAVMMDEPTAAVRNPGPAPRQPAPQVQQAPQAQLATVTLNDRPTQAVPTMLRVNAGNLPALEPSLVPMSRGSDAPPHMETAFVPVPGGAGAQTMARPQVPDQPPPLKQQKQPPPLQGLLHKIQSSKNARLGIIGGGGVLGILLVLVLFSPRPQQAQQVAPVEVSPQPSQAAEQRPPEPKQEETDPAKIEEKDALLEKAIAALEAGRTDEALAIFRRYTEEDPSPAAEFMVQFLQLQISQTGRER